MTTPSAPLGRLLRIDAGGLACTLILSAGGYLLGIEPSLNARTDLQRRTSDLDARNRDAQIAEANFRADLVRREQLQARVEALPFQLEPATKVNQRMVGLTQLADRAHLGVDTISPGKPEQTDLVAAVPIRLSGACSFATFLEFLAGLRDTFPDMTVHELKISGAPAAQGSSASYSLVCAWFASPPSANPAPATTPTAATAGVPDALSR